jgi:hypothetical protein
LTKYNANQLTLGDLIDALEKMPPKATLIFDRFGLCPDGSLDSYRGYYDQLALGYRHHPVMTAEELLKSALSMDGATVYGWKGGEYRVDRSTGIFVAETGDATQTMLVAIKRWGSPGYEGATFCTEQEYNLFDDE